MSAAGRPPPAPPHRTPPIRWLSRPCASRKARASAFSGTMPQPTSFDTKTTGPRTRARPRQPRARRLASAPPSMTLVSHSVRQSTSTTRVRRGFAAEGLDQAQRLLDRAPAAPSRSACGAAIRARISSSQAVRGRDIDPGEPGCPGEALAHGGSCPIARRRAPGSIPSRGSGRSGSKRGPRSSRTAAAPVSAEPVGDSDCQSPSDCDGSVDDACRPSIRAFARARCGEDFRRRSLVPSRCAAIAGPVPTTMNPVFADLPTSVFERMSRLAREHEAVNLGQGFPDDPGPLDVRRQRGRGRRRRLEPISAHDGPARAARSRRRPLPRVSRAVDFDPRAT